MGIFDSFKKGSDLAGISKILGKRFTQSDLQSRIHSPINIENMLAGSSDEGRAKRREEREAKEKALEDLIDLVENNETLKTIMNKYGANRDKLKSIYERLKSEGAGQWKSGHFVAASTLAFKQTLDYCLRSDKAGLRFGAVAGRCLMYFKDKETGEIKE